MSTPNAPARRSGSRARAVAAALLAVVALAAGALAGCGAPQAGSRSGGAPQAGSPSGATSQAGSPSGGASHAGSASGGSTPTAGPATASPARPPSAAPGTPGAASGSATAVSSGPAAPVQTVSGGPVTAGEPACAGWPADAPTASLPVSFVPVAVERCVNGAQTIPGKGLWQTASLQRADSGLDALVSALHQPSAKRQPGTECPAIAMIPPQVVLISATGQELRPRLPVSGCGLVQSQVIAALNALTWRLVSVRLIAKIPGSSGSGAVP